MTIIVRKHCSIDGLHFWMAPDGLELKNPLHQKKVLVKVLLKSFPEMSLQKIDDVISDLFHGLLSEKRPFRFVKIQRFPDNRCKIQINAEVSPVLNFVVKDIMRYTTYTECQRAW